MFEGEEYSVFRNPLVTMPELAGGGGGGGVMKSCRWNMMSMKSYEFAVFCFILESIQF